MEWIVIGGTTRLLSKERMADWEAATEETMKEEVLEEVISV
jgi:hypothetical protein